MRILVIAPVPFLETRGTPLSILERLKVMSKLCDNVDVVTYHVGEDISLKNVKLDRIPNLKFIKSVPVGPSLSKLFLDFILSVKVFFLLFKKNYSLIYSNEEGAIIGALYSKLFKIPHIYDFHSSLPEVLDNFGYKRYIIFKKVFIMLERFTINNSDALISISPALSEYVRSINKDIPIVTVENAVKFPGFTSMTIDELTSMKKQFSIDEKDKIVLYAGTFESYQGIDLLLKSVTLINNSDHDVKFIMIGGDEKQIEYYRKKSLIMGLDNYVVFAGKIPQEIIPAYYEIADVLVSPRTRGMNPPLKIYHYLQSGKPIVATKIIAHSQVLNDNIACLVNPDPAEFSDGILKILENKDYAESIADNALEFYNNTYGRNDSLEKIQEIFYKAMN